MNVDKTREQKETEKFKNTLKKMKRHTSHMRVRIR